MKIRILLAACCCVAFHSGADAQFSGYASASYGYQGNPLYNYASVADHVIQTYSEFLISRTVDNNRTQAGYISGLMLFNSLSERNYYEHSVWGAYRHSFDPPHDADEDTDQSNDLTPSRYFDLQLKGFARHDRSLFKEYDNFGAGVTGAYRWSTGDQSGIRLSNQFEYRSYVNLNALSNVTNNLVLLFETNPQQNLTVSLSIGAGYKAFTSSLVDTALYDQVSATGTGNGKGKGQGVGQSQGNSKNKKSIIANATSRGTSQLALKGGIKNTWSTGSFEAAAGYRFNPGMETRYLAQYSGSSVLSEDVYNDHFSYKGLALETTVQQELPGGFRSSLTGNIQGKSFSAPALSLAGETLADKRDDVHAALEFSLTKPFALNDALTLEVTFSAIALRNKSNDAFNDFSARSAAVGLGLSF